jgi:hypothetical protein
LFTPENSDQEDFISKCFLIHFGFSDLLELLENSYLNGNIFHLSSFTKNAMYSICCEAESEKEAFNWVQILSINIEKEKEKLLKFNLKQNVQQNRSYSMKLLHNNNASATVLEMELGETKKKIAEMKESIQSKKIQIRKLELENQDLIERSPIFLKKLDLLEEKLNQLRIETQKELIEIEETDKIFWNFFGRELEVSIIPF